MTRSHGDDFVPSYAAPFETEELQISNGTRGLPRPLREIQAAAPSIVVTVTNREFSPASDHEEDVLERTTKPHGLSGDEVVRLLNALHYLKRLGLPCLWVVLGDDLLYLSEYEARAVVHDFKRRIVREQERASLPQHWLLVLESSGGFHANMVFPAPNGMTRKIRNWKPFEAYLRSEKAIQEVYDHAGLGRYLAKERVPFAKGQNQCGPRLNGSHRLEGGGDRVLLSKSLRTDAIAEGIIEPWQRSKAKVLVSLKPEIIAPPIRLAASVEVQPMMNAEQPSLPLDLHEQSYLPPSEIRTSRKEVGCTQAEIARRLGIRDRSHVANAERGHDRFSPPRQRLFKHIIETLRLAA